MTETPRQHLLATSSTAFNAGDYSAACTALTELVKIDNLNAEVWSNLGYVHYLRGNFHSAIECCQKALQLDPSFIAAYSNLAIALQAVGQIEKSIEILQQGLAHNQNVADLHCNLGLAFQRLNQLSNAISSLRRAISIDPNSVQAHCNLASSLQDIGQHDLALAHYNKAIEINPSFLTAISNAIFSQQYHPRKNSAEILKNTVQFTKPLNNLNINQSIANAELNNEHIKNQHKRIGFISADFYAHPVGWFFIDVFEALSKQNLELLCFNNGRKHDVITDRFNATAHSFINIANMNDTEAAQLIRSKQLDILIDLSGHTAGNRIGVLASRVSPLQLTWLGFPASVGIGQIDGHIVTKDLIVA